MRVPRTLPLIAVIALLLAAPQSLAADDLSQTHDAKELLALTEKPHTPKLDIEALKVFTKAREYEVRVKQTNTDGSEFESDPIKVTEKWVDGRYIVSFLHLPDLPRPVYMIATYDEKSLCYRKWGIGPDDAVFSTLGLRHDDSGVISWTGEVNGENGNRILFLAQERQEDDRVTWSEAYYRNGKLLRRVDGEAKVTKR